MIITTDIFSFLGIFTVGAVTGVIGSTVGSGSLLSIPFLIFLGLPPQVAIATNIFGSLGTLTTLLTFMRAKKIVWKHVPLLTVLSISGSLVGTFILLNISASMLRIVVGALILFLLPAIFLKKSVGIERRKISTLSMLLAICIYFLIQALTGFIGGGTGALIFFTLILGFGLSIIEANATQIIPVFGLYLSSLAIFATHNLINYSVGFILMGGMALGGYIGAHIALKKGDEWIKRLFFIMVFVMAIKLLFFK